MESFTSILFPGAATVDGDVAVPDCFADLYLDQVVTAVAAEYPDDGLEGFFHRPLHDVGTVVYRHGVFRDLQRDDVRRAVRDFVTRITTVRKHLHWAAHFSHPLQRQGWFVDATEGYCAAVQGLHDALARLELASPGLGAFADYVAGYVGGERFQTLRSDTREVRDQLGQVGYTVHIEGLRVRVERYAGQPDYSVQVTDTFRRFVTEDAKDYRVPMQDFPDMNNVEEQILNCVAKLYPANFSRLHDFCHRHAEFVAPVIDRFDREVRFYLAYLVFMARLGAAGLSFSYPEVGLEPGTVRVDGAFDPALALRSIGDGATPVVPNGFHLGDAERIFIVTGPNQGGKTTFARTVGQCLYLASLGCPVPADRAVLMLPDHIYTHFERREALSTLHGKLDDELVRIHDILARATAMSVVVMNESFASTTADDALLIGTEVLRRITQLGCVAVYVTFLDELAGLSPACVSMVGDVARDDPRRRTFRFTRRIADGRAYAAALAGKYGLTHDALLRRIGK